MRSLLVLPQVGGVAEPPIEMTRFASPAHPMRPSKSAKFAGCPMSTILSMWAEDKGNASAQTGNLIHDAVEAFHKTKDARVEAGLKALADARVQFPDGDPKKAEKVFRAYAADPENVLADVRYVEEPVSLWLAPAPEDKTGQPVVIEGTLDQVRVMPEDANGDWWVWDVKTGDRFTAEETATEYLIQQAVYMLAANQMLDSRIKRCGVIYTPNYEKNRGKRFVPLPLSLETAILLIAPLVHWVAQVRAGIMQFRPSVDSCAFCPVKPWPKCINVARTAFGSSILQGV